MLTGFCLRLQLILQGPSFAQASSDQPLLHKPTPSGQHDGGLPTSSSLPAPVASELKSAAAGPVPDPLWQESLQKAPAHAENPLQQQVACGLVLCNVLELDTGQLLCPSLVIVSCSDPKVAIIIV